MDSHPENPITHFCKASQEQESPFYQQKLNFVEILASPNNFNSQFLNNLIIILKKEKSTDSISFLSNDTSKLLIEQHFRQMDLSPPSLFDLLQLKNIMKNILALDFNKKNISLDKFDETRKTLITNISQQEINEKSLLLLKFLVHLTAIDSRFIQSGSTSLCLLVELRADLQDQSFEDIRIKDTHLIGGNFVRSNLSGSEFSNVDISGINLNGAILFNCKWRNLKIQEVNKLDGHSKLVTSICFSPDGATLASGSYDKSISLWDVKSGQQRAKLDGHSDYVTTVCFSPDGATLASGSNDQSIRLWNVMTGQQREQLDGHSDYVRSVCLSPDGSTLASGSSDNSIRLWDFKTGQQRAKLDGHSHYVTSVCFSPDGATIASGSDDKSIRLWDVVNQRQLRILDCHSDQVASICFSPYDSTLASGSYDQSIRLWNVKISKQIQTTDKRFQHWKSQFNQQDLNSIQQYSATNTTVLRIAQSLEFQVKQALILKGEYVNHQGYNLIPLMFQKGAVDVESELKKQ